jgi:hypothetical protein
LSADPAADRARGELSPAPEGELTDEGDAAFADAAGEAPIAGELEPPRIDAHPRKALAPAPTALAFSLAPSIMRVSCAAVRGDDTSVSLAAK